jgi:hypothetical protein
MPAVRADDRALLAQRRDLPLHADDGEGVVPSLAPGVRNPPEDRTEHETSHVHCGSDHVRVGISDKVRCNLIPEPEVISKLPQILVAATLVEG